MDNDKIKNKFLKRIKRVSKGYWALVMLLAVSSYHGKPSVLLYIAWAVVAGYLVWKMQEEE